MATLERTFKAAAERRPASPTRTGVHMLMAPVRDAATGTLASRTATKAEERIRRTAAEAQPIVTAETPAVAAEEPRADRFRGPDRA